MECEHFIIIATNTIITTVKITMTETAIAGPIMAAMLSGLPGMVVGVGVTIADPSVRPDPDSELSGRDIANPGARVDSRKAKQKEEIGQTSNDKKLIEL